MPAWSQSIGLDAGFTVQRHDAGRALAADTELLVDDADLMLVDLHESDSSNERDEEDDDTDERAAGDVQQIDVHDTSLVVS